MVQKLDDTHRDKNKKLPLPIKLVVGAIAGDTVKTRLQANSAAKNLNPFEVFRGIIVNEGGIRALYRGLSANLVGVTPEKAIKLAANEHFRELFEKEDGTIDLHEEIISGASAGVCQVIATNPMELTKIRMQMQALLPVGERKSLIEIVKSLGIRGLYSGTPATLLRDVPFSFLFFPGYANLKKFLADKNGGNSTLSLLIAGGGAGAISAGAVTPADVIKTRLQVAGGKEKYKTIANTISVIYKEEGIGAFYKGIIPRMAVVGPLFAITLLSFEAQKNYMIRNGLL